MCQIYLPVVLFSCLTFWEDETWQAMTIIITSKWKSASRWSILVQSAQKKGRRLTVPSAWFVYVTFPLPQHYQCLRLVGYIYQTFFDSLKITFCTEIYTNLKRLRKRKYQTEMEINAQFECIHFTFNFNRKELDKDPVPTRSPYIAWESLASELGDQ